MTGLGALGWDVIPARHPNVTGPQFVADRPSDGAGAFVRHPDSAVAERMAVVAALVAEGHDLLDIIETALDYLPDPEDPIRREDALILAELLVRMDAVLAAARGGS